MQIKTNSKQIYIRIYIYISLTVFDRYRRLGKTPTNVVHVFRKEGTYLTY